MKFILENIKAVLSIIIMVIILIIGYKFYASYETKDSLRSTINKRDGTIDALDNTNKNLNKNLDIAKEANKITNSSLEKSAQEHSKNIREAKQTNAVVEKKVDTIREEYNTDIKAATTPEDTAALAVKKDKAISKTRIDGLWANYCKTEPTSPDCGVKK